MNVISFPNLGLTLEIDPIALRLPLGVKIHWYGVIIGAAMVLAMLLVCHEFKKKGYDPDSFFDIVLVTIPLSIVGARLYYVIFKWENYKDSLKDVIAVWEGGLAIYGGIIAGAICVFFMTRKKGIPFLPFADMAVMGCMIAQSIGRWGNFVNAEAHGGETSLPWGMSINGAEPVHPTFLYESIWNLLDFLIVYFVIYRLGKTDGRCLAFYMIWYGAGRFFIEGLRTDSLYIGAFRVSQIVAAASVIGGIIIYAVMRLKTKSGEPV